MGEAKPDTAGNVAQFVAAHHGAPWQEDLRAGVSLRAACWFRVGGEAQFMFTPRSVAVLQEFLKARHAFAHPLPLHVLGAGTNTLFRDGGYRGIVVRLPSVFREDEFPIEQIDAHTLRVAAGVLDRQVAQFASNLGIGGMAFLYGVPGKVGGGVAMNAGAHGGDFAGLLRTIDIVDRLGARRTLDVAALNMGYRHAELPEDSIVIAVTLAGVPSTVATEHAAMAEVASARAATQPTKARTGGSTFKNPLPQRAWQLIDAAGCRGLEHRGVQVSELHCNFLINNGGANAEAIEQLGETVRGRVRAQTGIALEWEIKRIGCAGSPLNPPPTESHV